ncbi:PQQ-binding-like beta-propeller repeat protein [Cellulomonas sp.]|uniref:outer membrane protein assembly factor BamB family protein n=1 Tax=Cellulomonas sp. TaxID=40001 RepID=UPI002588E2D7|nr:PQQ-binding-like beta-propeller repeat protein [Cellulomonas sp.]MCR6689076.1 PQQ-like beta-propeller repeat protein [Cellulomonas sp.]
MAAGMQRVEVVEGDDDDVTLPGDPSSGGRPDDDARTAPGRVPDDGAGPAPRRGRGSRRGWLVVLAGLLVLVVGLVVGQAVIDARHRAQVARWGKVPGVLAPIGDRLTVAGELPTPGDWLAVVPGADGAVGTFAVGRHVADDGSTHAYGVDVLTGGEAWAVTLDTPAPERADERVWVTQPCVVDEVEAGGPLVCLVTDRVRGWDDQGGLATLRSGRTGSVVVIDVDSGQARRWDAEPADGVQLFGDLAVTSLTLGTRPGPGPSVRLIAYDVRTGERRWSTTVTVPVPAVGGMPTDASFEDVANVSVGGGLLLVSSMYGTGMVALDASGQVAELPPDAVSSTWFDRHTALMGGAGTTVLVRDGVVVASARGGGVIPTVDDGSSDIALLTVDDGLRAWGTGGEKLWHLRGVEPSEAILLGGGVYVVDGKDVVAVDARTGTERWRRAMLTDVSEDFYAGLVTDGRRLYVTLNDATGDGEVRVTAVDLGGEEITEVALPPGTQHIYPGARALWNSRWTDEGAGSLSLLR